MVDFLFQRTGNDRTLFHSEDFRIAFPACQGFTVEQRAEAATVFTLQSISGGEQYERQCQQA